MYSGAKNRVQANKYDGSNRQKQLVECQGAQNAVGIALEGRIRGSITDFDHKIHKLVMCQFEQLMAKVNATAEEAWMGRCYCGVFNLLRQGQQ